jgi:adenylate kinase
VQDKQSKNGIILDGFPRTQTQLHIFDSHFKVNVVLNLLLRLDVLIDKLLGRRACPLCGGNYNICDIQRDDYSM